MKATKKIISVVLAIMLIAVPFLSISANAMRTNAAPNRQYPTIDIAGFMASTIYAEKGNPDSEVLWPISADYIMGYVKQILPMLAKFALTWNWDKLGEETTPVLKEMLGTAILDSNGEPSDGSGICFTYPEASHINKASVLTFRYDWRLDPMQIADELNNFIEYVCAAAGTDQVCITCHSLGGVMTLAYITVYGDSRIHSIVMNSTAVFGETYNGELMTGQMKLNGEGISEYVQYAMDGNEYEELVDSVMKLLDDMKLTDFVAKFGDLIIEKLADYWIPEVIVPMFAYWPAIWAMVPDEYMNDAKQYVFEDVMADTGIDYTNLINKIDSFQVVRDNRVDNLIKLNEDSNMYVITRYGYSSIPITPSWDTTSDGVIDTKNASYGATVTAYGTTFDASYVTPENAEYISPDMTVDASTCMFPDQTWFIKGLGHSVLADGLDDMIMTMLHYDGQGDVYTWDQYPRWLEYNSADESVVADTSVPAVKPTGIKAFIESIKNYFNMIKNLFKTLFGLIKK